MNHSEQTMRKVPLVELDKAIIDIARIAYESGQFTENVIAAIYKRYTALQLDWEVQRQIEQKLTQKGFLEKAESHKQRMEMVERANLTDKTSEQVADKLAKHMKKVRRTDIFGDKEAKEVYERRLKLWQCARALGSYTPSRVAALYEEATGITLERKSVESQLTTIKNIIGDGLGYKIYNR